MNIFKDVFEQVNTLRMTWSENEDTVEEEDDEKKNLDDLLIQRFHLYLKALPAIGFNSGNYDRNVTKKNIPAYLLDDDADEEEDGRSLFTSSRKTKT